jgi:uncharacterized protein YlzI (FlbEa/FlbD family)
MMFITLTRTGGQAIAVNTDQIASVRDRAEGKNVVVMLANGNDFEVTEGYEDIVGKLAQA